MKVSTEQLINDNCTQQPLTFLQLQPGMKVRVKSICCLEKGCQPMCLKRLQEMGLTEGSEFEVVKVAPFGDPIEIQLRGYRLCIRKCEACGFLLEEVE